MALRRNDFIQREGLHTMSIDTHADGSDAPLQFLEQARANQARLVGALQPHYDFVVCGAGSSGSVVARRLAENPDVSVLLVEAGGDDDVPSVTQPGQWVANIGTERDWGFQSQPNFRVNDRSIPFSMGKVLGGGSSINLMIWARGHRSDWDLFAAEAGDPAWNYDSVLATYLRIEDWHGAADPAYRGTGGRSRPIPQPVGARHGGRCTLGRHTDVREPSSNARSCRATRPAANSRPSSATPPPASGTRPRTAKMGQNTMSVVNGALEVYGVEKLRIADGSIMPRITTGNTMAPCVIIGERAAEFVTAQHRL